MCRSGREGTAGVGTIYPWGMLAPVMRGARSCIGNQRPKCWVGESGPASNLVGTQSRSPECGGRRMRLSIRRTEGRAHVGLALAAAGGGLVLEDEQRHRDTRRG